MVSGWCLSPLFLTRRPCLTVPWCADCYAALNLPLALYPDPSCIRGDQLSAQSIPLFLLTDHIALRTQTWRLEERQRSTLRIREINKSRQISIHAHAGCCVLVEVICYPNKMYVNILWPFQSNLTSFCDLCCA